MTNPHLIDKEIASATGTIARGVQVSVDPTSLGNISATDAQLLASQVNQNVADIQSLQNAPAGIRRPVNLFDSSTVVGSGNYDDFVGNRNIYIGTSQITFQPPTEAIINNRFPSSFEIENFSTGTNFIRIVRPADFNGNVANSGIARRSGNRLSFMEDVIVPAGASALIEKVNDASVWEVTVFFQDQRASILPSGIFTKQSNIARLRDTGTLIAIDGLPRSGIEAGYAYEVDTDTPVGAEYLGQDLADGDFIVAKINDPINSLSATGDDWLVIKDSRNGVINNNDFSFLAEVRPVTETVDRRLIDDGDVSAVRVFASRSLLTTAPFITPSTDNIDNPVDVDGFQVYYGGNENRGVGNEFEFNRDLGSQFIYVDIDGAFPASRLGEVYLIVENREGEIQFTFDLDDSFDAQTLTGSGDTYYGLSFNDANPGLDTLLITENTILKVVIRSEGRKFRTSDNIDVRESIPDETIAPSKLTTQLQQIITRAGRAQDIPATDPKLQTFADHLTISENSISGWRNVVPNPIAPLEVNREFRFLHGATHQTALIDEFADQDGAEISNEPDNFIFAYNDSNRHLNRSFPGVDSYILNHNVPIDNKSPGNSISAVNPKIVGFSFANQLSLSSTDSAEHSVVKYGTSRPLIGFSGREGLYLNVGRGDGGQHSRTYDEQLSVLNSQWSTHVDVATLGEAVIPIPSSINAGEDIRIDILGLNNDNDEGTHSETVTITNLGSAQSFGTRTFSYSIQTGGSFAIDVTIEYRLNFGNVGRALVLTPTHALTNAAFVFVISAYHRKTERWNTSESFAEFPINVNQGHDSQGIFDPSLFQLVEQRVNMVYAVHDYRLNDSSADPEQAVTVGVQHVGESIRTYTARLHRAKSDLTLDDLELGNSQFAVGNIIGLNYPANDDYQISEANLNHMLVNFDNNLGLVTDENDLVETFTLNGNIRLTPGNGIILPAGTTSDEYTLSLDDSGDVITVQN